MRSNPRQQDDQRRSGRWRIAPACVVIPPLAAVGVLFITIASLAAPAADQPAPPAAEHFDKAIAPILARHCLECHNATMKKGKLDLSQKATAMAGGDSGAVIVPGKPGDSLLWQNVKSNEMPRKRTPLSSDEKQLLRRWIESGAAWGAAAIDPLAYSSDRRAGYDWWSLQPVKRAAPPQVKDASWPVNDIDRFTLARLEAAGLKPAPQADRRTLIRRLYFDLIGLPPTPAAVDRFINDKSPKAYDDLVDELLRSPHYGERWARHWLDVVRFGESQGYERNKIRDNAWRYRDWVVDALNRDLPYDQFVQRQIAGDVLYPGDLDAMLATGYHVCGTWDQVAHLEGSAMMRKAARQDQIEDLVATLGQAFLGLTVACARCHDHKFDPIAQQDYYQMAALLGGVRQAESERTVTATRDNQREAQLRKQIGQTGAQLTALEADLRAKYQKEKDARPIDGLQLLYEVADQGASTVDDQSQAGDPIALQAGKPARFTTRDPPKRVIGAIKSSGELTVEAWITPAKEQQSGPARIVTLSKDSGQRNFTLGQDGDKFDLRLRTTKTNQNGIPSLATPGGMVTKKKTHVVFTFDRTGTGRLYVNGKPVAEQKIGGDLSNWDEGYRLGLGDELSGQRRWDGAFHFVALYSKALSRDQVRRNFDTESRDIRAGEPFEKLLPRAAESERARHRDLIASRNRMTEELAHVSYSGPAHVIVTEQPEVFHVLARGDFRQPKQVVAPAGLSALTRMGLPGEFGLAPDAPEAQRRIKLAQWLTDRRNPLTARVFVNRLWHYHFGVGIVDTPSDFGFVGGRPTHPRLLDFLAARLMDGGWKIKDMHRFIVTSATYRQQSQVTNDKAQRVDADNRLLWRFNAHRLEGEAIRDAVLFVSGALNPQIGGPSYRDMKVNGGVMGTNAEFTDPTGEFSDKVNRRTIYRLWARSGNHPMLESLDCPDPSVATPRRTQTITPLQALSLLNNTFMEQCAQRFAQRVRKEAGDDLNAQIDRAYRLALARSPKAQEKALLRQFAQEQGMQQLCLVLLNANEFLFVN